MLYAGDDRVHTGHDRRLGVWSRSGVSTVDVVLRKQMTHRLW